jgi:hypothetical protein
MKPVALLINFDDSNDETFVSDLVEALTGLGYTVHRDESGMFGDALRNAERLQPDLVIVHASTCPWYEADSTRPVPAGSFENWANTHPGSAALHHPATVTYLKSNPLSETSHIRPERVLPDIPALLAHLDYVIDELPV